MLLKSHLIESNVTPNVTRSAVSFKTVPLQVLRLNGDEFLEKIIVFVLLAFNFIPYR